MTVSAASKKKHEMILLYHHSTSAVSTKVKTKNGVVALCCGKRME